jgi:hypothetical protein
MIVTCRVVVHGRPGELGVDHDPLDKGRRQGVGWWAVGSAGSTSLQCKKLQHSRSCERCLGQACSLGVCAVHRCDAVPRL